MNIETPQKDDTGQLDLVQEQQKADIAIAQAQSETAAPQPDMAVTSAEPSVAPAKSDTLSYVTATADSLAVSVGIPPVFSAIEAGISFFKSGAAQKDKKFQSAFGPFMVNDDRTKANVKQGNARSNSTTPKKNKQNDAVGPFNITHESMTSPVKGITAKSSPALTELKKTSASLKRAHMEGPLLTADLLETGRGHMPESAQTMIENNQDWMRMKLGNT